MPVSLPMHAYFLVNSGGEESKYEVKFHVLDSSKGVRVFLPEDLVEV